MQVPKCFKPHPLLALLTTLGAMGTSSLVANPQAPQVANGQASFVQNGSTLTVTNTPGAIINWQQFNIGRGELTRFVQQSAASQVLNRVVGVDPSTILGSLQSNGRVFLINPNGIVFGAGSQVDVAGLVASTLKLSNEDFLAQRLKFGDGGPAGAVKNEGTIRTATGGEVLLLAPRVENSGLIHSPEGKILLAAGRSVEVADIDKPLIRVEISNTTEEAVNLGTLMARNISIYGGLVQNAGRIQASSAVIGENGKVTLRGKVRVELAPTSVIEATGSTSKGAGTTGGDIDISAENALGLNGGGEVLVQGVLSVKPVLLPADLAALTPNLSVQSAGAPSASFTSQNTTQVLAGYAQVATDSIANDHPIPASQVAVTEVTAPSPTQQTAPLTAAQATPGLPLASLAVGLIIPSAAAMPSPPSAPVRPFPDSSSLPIAPAPLPAPSPGSGNLPSGYGVGGNIRVSARGRVSVGDGAVLDASGPLGGGSIMVGGGWQGLNPNIITSDITYIAKTATLYANADLRGNGGLVVVWANDMAQIYGKVAAHGGVQGGDGGQIETSGKRMLDIADGWIADASAGTYADGTRGKAGLWLLDPNNVTITTGTDTNVTGNPNFSTTADSAIITVNTIQTALNNGINVTITTSPGGVQTGDITLSSAITTSSATDVSLTLSAHNNININSGISATGAGKLNLVLNANSDATGGGAATLAAGTLALKGGTLSSSNGTSLVWSGGTLSNVNLGTNVNLTGTGYISTNLGLAGGVSLTFGNNANLYYIGNTSISGSGTIDLAGNNAQLYRNNTNTSLTIGSGITVQASGSNTTNVWLGYYSDETIILSPGAIWNVSNSAKTWYTGNVSNQGTLNVSTGGVYLGAYSGNGTFSNNGGTINLSGGFITLGNNNGDTIQSSDLGSINQTGGTAYLNGTLVLGGNTLNLSTSGLTGLVLNNTSASSGAVVSGTTGNLLTANAGFNLSWAAGTLSNVNLGTNVNLTGTGYISTNLGLAGGVSLTFGNNANLYYIGNTSISGSGTIDLAGNNAQLYRNNTNTSLTIGSGITVQASGSNTTNVWLGYYSDETIILSPGAIWNVSNSAKTWYTGNVSNQGTLNVSAGALNLGAYSGTGTWSSTVPINLQGGSLTLTDNYTAASLATINKTGGTLNVSGNLDNTGNTLDTAFLSGGILNGGSITGGRIIASTGVTLTAIGTPTLSGVTLGSVTFPTLTISGDIVATGVTLDNATVNMGTGTWNMGGAGTQHLATLGNSTLNMAGGGIRANYSNTQTLFVFDAGVTINGYGSIYNYYGANIRNDGIINANVAGQTLTISPTDFANAGTLNATAGTTTLSATTWSNTGALNVAGGIFNLSGTTSGNTGTLNVSAGTMNLGGNIATPTLGSFTRTGGLVNITGAFNNASQTLDIGSAGIFGTGGLNSLSGSITGGRIIASTGVTLTAIGTPTLSGVTLGSVTFPTLTISGDIVATGVTLDNATVNMGTGTWNMGGAGTQHLATLGNSTLNMAGGGIRANYSNTQTLFVFDAGVTINGYGSIYNYYGANIRNDGIINANVAGQTLTISPTDFANAGTLNATAGTTTLSATTWSNTGALNVAGGIFNLSGTTSGNTGTLNVSAGTMNLGGNIATPTLGSFTRTGGLVNITGAFNNASQTLDIGSAGIFGTGGLNSLSGSITGGRIIASTGVTLTAIGTPTLSGVTLGSVTFPTLTISGDIVATGVTLDNATVNIGTGTWNMGGAGTQHLATLGNSTLNMAGGGIRANYSNTQTLFVFDAGVTINGYGSIYNYYGANIRNDGIINANVAGQTLTISPTTFDNNGTLSVTSGTLNTNLGFGTNTGTINVAAGATFSRASNASLTNNGTILNGGNLSLGTGTLTNNGILNPGASPGFSTITGNLTLTGSSVVNIEIAGYARGVVTGYDAIHVTGNVTLGGTVNVLETSGFVANLGDVFHIVSAGGTRSGGFATVFPPNGLEPFALGVDAKNAFLQRGNSFTGVNVWNTDSSGNFNVAANWSNGVVPTSGDTVLIDRGPLANPVITINSVISVNKLTATESVTIASGGGLSVAAEATFEANLSLAAGGSLTLGGVSSVSGTYTQSGGTLGGTGTLTLKGAGNTWSGTSGTWTGGGAVNLASGADLSFTGSGSFGNIFAGRSLNIASGATATLNGRIELDAGTNAINNAGTLNWVSGDIQHSANSAGSLTLTNSNVINKTTASTFTLGSGGGNVDLINNGALNINAGTLNYATGTGSSAGTVTLAAGTTWQTSGGTISFDVGSTFNSAGNLLFTGGSTSFAMPTANFTQTGNLTTSAGTVGFTPDVNVPQINLSGGTNTFNGATTTPSYTQTGGTLGGAGTLTLAGAGNTWSGTSGTWTGGGTVALTSGASLTFTGSGSFGNIFAGRTLNIASGATATINGRIELDAGTNAINNTGTLNWVSGDIQHSANSAGSLTLTNSSVINKTTASTFTLGSGGGNVDLVNNGTLNINAGTLNYATGTGSSTGTVTLAAGTTWQASGAAMAFAAGSTFNSVGNLLFTGGTSSFSMPTANFTQTGNISISGGTVTLTPDVNVPIVNLSGGTTNFNGSATTSLFTQTGGTLGGAGTLTLTGAGNTWSGTSGTWTGGGAVNLASGADLSFTGSGSFGNIFAGRTLNIASGATATINGRIELDAGTNAINNAGTLNWVSGDIQHSANSAGSLTLTNSSIINKTTASTFTLGSGAGNVDLINNGVLNINAGTLNYATGTGSSTGTVTLASGTTWQTSGGAMTFGAGSTFNSAGNLLFSAGTTDFAMPAANFTQTGNISTSNGTVNFTPNVNVPSVNLSGGITNFNGNTSTPLFTQSGGTLGGTGTLTLTGAGNTWSGTSGAWTGGGSVVLASGSDLTFTGSGSFGNILAGRTLSIASGATATINGRIELDAGTNAINNAGTLNWVSGDIQHSANSAGSLTLTNSSIINKTTASTFTLGSGAGNVDLVNNGVLNINAGTLNYATGTGTGTGTIKVSTGTTFAKPGGFTNNGTITGNGTVDVTGGTLTNAGTIRPDGGGADLTGTLSVTGNFTQTAAGTLDMQAEGTAAGTFDRLAITGTATLDGAINLTPASGFVPSAGNTFDLVTYAGSSGAFATINAAAFTVLTPTYGLSGVSFQAGASCTVDDCWIGTSGDWSIGSNWSTGLAPTAGQRVRVSVVGLQTITMTGGTFSLTDLISDENITIAGGNLGISGVFSAPVLNLSSGSVGGAGSFTVTSDFNQTGGSFNPTGNLDLTRSLGHFNVGSLASNGTIRLATVGAFDIALNGSIQTGISGLGDNVAAISVTAGRDIGIASTSNLTATNSGAIVLTAAGVIDLKMNDGGYSGANNALAAAGNLQLTAGGSIYRSDSNVVSLAAKTISVTTGGAMGPLGGAITASTGGINLTATSGMTVDTATATLGAIDLQSGTGTLSVGALSANTSIIAHSGASMSMGPLTSGSGPITLTTTGTGSHLTLSSVTSGTGLITLTNSGASDITLNGSIQTGISGLGDNVAAISVTAGRDIGIASTSNLTATNSGAIVLTAAGVIDLKMNDGGYSGANNALAAAGNLQLTAGGSIYRSDSNAITAIGKTIDLTYGSTLDPAITLAPVDALNITLATGNLTLNSSSQAAAQRYTALAGDIIFAPSASFTGGPVTVGGNGTAQFNAGVVNFASAFVANMPVVVAGATVNFNDSAPQVISGGAWNINSGALNLPAAGASVAAGSSLTVGAGTVSFATGGAAAFSNAGTVTAGSNLLLPGDFTNLAGATANLTGNTIGGSLFNAGTFNVGGTVAVAGTQVVQQGGVINIPAGATLDTSNAAGTFTWSDGTISGAGTLAFTGGGMFVFGGTGNRVIDGLNFSFNNLTLPNGSLTVRSGSLTLNGATVLPDGVALNLDGGTLTNNGTLDVAGTFGLTGGAFAGAGSLTMSGGSMTLPAGNTVAWSNSGTLTNTGTLNLADSTITNAIVNQGTIQLGNGLVFSQTLVNTGTIVAGSGSTTQFNGGLTQQAGGALVLEGGSLNGNLNITQGVIRGSGTINGDVVVGAATFAPGFSPGSITVNGNLVLSGSSVLNIELGGLARGSGYDWVNVLGTASLAGVVNVIPYGGFVAPAGSSYTFMNFSASTGSFASVNFSAVAGMVFSQQAQSLMLSVNALVVPTVLVAPSPTLISPLLVVNPVLVAEDKLFTVAELTVDLRRTVEKAKSEVEREPELEVCP